MEVVLAAKEDFKNELGLSYYSNQIMQSQILDCCVAFLLTKHFNTPSESRQPLTSQMVEAQVKDLYSILRFEFIEKLK
jgi:glycerol-3-phosphate O-acyltransferase